MKALHRLTQVYVTFIALHVAAVSAITPTEMSLNRTGSGLSSSEMPYRAVTGFKWQQDDGDSLCWMPQGITGIESPSGPAMLVVSWHNDPFARFDFCGDQKGSRLSFIDMSDSQSPKYRHVLLVDEAMEVIHGHAGGVSYHNGKLHVANTHRVDVYDADSIIEVENTAAVFNYRYVLQRQTSYPLPANASFLSYDHSREQFLGGHFTNSLDPSLHTLKWYSPEPDLTSEVTTQIEDSGFFHQMQGAASSDDVLWVSSSYAFVYGKMQVARYSPEDGTLLGAQSVTAPAGIEDLYTPRNNTQLWTLTEFTQLQSLFLGTPGHRLVYAYDRTTFLPNEPVSDLTQGDQSTPVIASDSFGNYVAAAAADHDNDGYSQIFVSAFNAEGEPYFTNYMASSPSPQGQQILPTIALNDQGDIIIAWQDDSDGDQHYDIQATGITLYGEQRIARFTVNTTTAQQQYDPSIAIDNNGNFVVAWEDDNDGNGWFQIYGRGFFSNGTQRFPEQTLNAIDDGQQYNPVVAIDGYANVLIAWQDDLDKNKAYNILARGFTLDGSENIAQYSVHADSAGDQRHPAMAMNASGQYVVSWSDDRDGNGKYNIAARVFDSQGNALADEFVVNNETSGAQNHPAVAIDSQGRSIIAWQDDADNNGFYDISVGHLDSQGQKLGPQFIANMVSEGIQLSPAAALLANGTSFILWDNDTQVIAARVNVVSSSGL